MLKKILAAVIVALVTTPVAVFACGGGDCSGMELPPPPVPVPGPMENLLGVLSDHVGLLAGCALAMALAFGLARQRNLIATKSSGQSLAGSAP